MAGKGMITVIVLCFTYLAQAADTVSNPPFITPQAKVDQRFFVSDNTQITMGPESLALGALLLGIAILALLILPALLGGEEAATATAYTAPSAYAQDPYAARSARSTFSVLKALDKAASKFL